jgi:hypothetical protein
LASLGRTERRLQIRSTRFAHPPARREIFNLTDPFMTLFEKRIDADRLFAAFCGPSRCKISAGAQGHKLLILFL